MKIGFIGYGNMGAVLLNALLEKGGIAQENLFIQNRTKEKLLVLKDKYPEITIIDTRCELVKKTDIIFICTKTMEVKNVMEEIKEELNSEKHIVTISGGLEIFNLEKYFKGKITKIMPTINAMVYEGVTLVCHNNVVDEVSKKNLSDSLGKIGTVKEIKENQFEVGADFTSCAPAFIAKIFQDFIEAGLKHSDLSREDAEEMVRATLYGTAKLLYKEKIDFDKLKDMVATKGGISEEGLKVLDSKQSSMYDLLFEKTLEKHEIVKKMVREQY